MWWRIHHFAPILIEPEEPSFVQPKSLRSATPWAFLPALVLLAATIVTMAGVSLIPSATAAPPSTDTRTVIVNGLVDGNITFSANPCAGATGTVAFADTFIAGGPSEVTPDCAAEFATNNVAGAELLIVDADGVTPFFCTGACSGDTAFNDQATDDAALEADAFGVALVSIGGTGAVRSFDTDDIDTDPQPADDSWYGIDDLTAKQICRNAAPTAGTICTLRFAGNPKAAQTSGAYTGTALLTASTL